MTALHPSTQCQALQSGVPSGGHQPQSQHGVVLIIALILLVIISLLAVTSMRGASSAESIAGNVRTTELATQAAEIALRHCESSAIRATKLIANPSDESAEATYPTTLLNANILRATTSVKWTDTSTISGWDSAATAAFVLPSTLVGGTTTYKRPPECMVESLTGTVANGTGAFVITARGFGPEVAADLVRPQGTEVWLQSTIEIE
jgi:type IV pilus assembly protein PilX